MRVFSVPCLQDNLAFAILFRTVLILIDPVEVDKVLSIAGHNLTPAAVLITHHHSDHAGGNAALCNRFPDVPIFGGDSRIPHITNQIHFGEKDQVEFTIADLIHVKAISTPCHTKGSVCYLISTKEDSSFHLFTGDTLFLGGCGRFFEGTPSEMLEAMKKLSTLPEETLVYPGHEYTIKNLQFAHEEIEPENQNLKERLERLLEDARIQEKEFCSVPGTIREELSTNPFMRIGFSSYDPEQLMKFIREKKDKWKS